VTGDTRGKGDSRDISGEASLTDGDSAAPFLSMGDVLPVWAVPGLCESHAVISRGRFDHANCTIQLPTLYNRACWERTGKKILRLLPAQFREIVPVQTWPLGLFLRTVCDW